MKNSKSTPATRQRGDELATRNNQLTEIPDYLRDLPAAEGFEEVRPGEIKFPRLALAQALTPQLEETEPNYIPMLKKGDFFNTISSEIYGPSIRIVPLLKFGMRLLFRAKDEGGGILCRSDDMKIGVGEPGGDCAKCPLAQFGSAKNGKGKGTACNEFKNFPALIIGNDGRIHPENLIIVSMKSSHIPAADQLVSLARFRKMPMYAGVYKIESKLKKFPEGSAYIPVIENSGWIHAEDAASARSAYEFMKSIRDQGRLAVDIVDEPDAPQTEPGEKAPF